MLNSSEDIIAEVHSEAYHLIIKCTDKSIMIPRIGMIVIMDVIGNQIKNSIQNDRLYLMQTDEQVSQFL